MYFASLLDILIFGNTAATIGPLAWRIHLLDPNKSTCPRLR